MKISEKPAQTIGEMVQQKLEKAKKIKIKLPPELKEAAQKLAEKTNPDSDKFIK